jgi:hypothetical protein
VRACQHVRPGEGKLLLPTGTGHHRESVRERVNREKKIFQPAGHRRRRVRVASACQNCPLRCSFARAHRLLLLLVPTI